MQDTNQIWINRSLKNIWHPCTQMKSHEQFPLLAIQKAQGLWLYDHHNQAYLDAISSWWVNLFGHAHPTINQAIKDQLDTLEHIMLAGCTHPPAVELAEQLSAKTHHQLGHAFFASDGASAVEIALKMSFHAWQNLGFPQKKQFVCVENSYHGETIGALRVTDIPIFKQSYQSLSQSSHVVRSPDLRQITSEKDAASITQLALKDVRALFEAQSHTIAALIIEPLVQCAAGMLMHSPEYLKGLHQLCNEFKVHLIADEIAVGCGRTNTFFACEQANIWPDLLCLSKGISGGYLPLSIVLSTEQIYQTFYDDQISKAFLHSHSYTGNPLACRAALATLALFDQENTLSNNHHLAQYIFQQLRQGFGDHPLVQHLRHCGMIFAFDVNLPQAQASIFSKTFFKFALQNHILVRPIGTTVYLMPPYIIDEEAVQFLLIQLQKTLNECLTELQTCV